MRRDREQRPKRMSEVLRERTEKSWDGDRYSADGGGVCGDWDHWDHSYSAADDDGNEELL